MKSAPYGGSLYEKISHYGVTVNANGCLLWNGDTGQDGYPTLRYRGKKHRLHRLVLSSAIKPPSEQHFACHTCDNILCININHLWWGTAKENSQDMMREQRHRWQK